jgi:integrase/recombinase XerD
MNNPSPATAISPLRQRLIDDMNVRRFSRETQRNYIRDVGRFATFLRRSPDTATADDVRRFQIEQRDAGVPTPTMKVTPDATAASADLRWDWAGVLPGSGRYRS